MFAPLLPNRIDVPNSAPEIDTLGSAVRPADVMVNVAVPDPVKLALFVPDHVPPVDVNVTVLTPATMVINSFVAFSDILSVVPLVEKVAIIDLSSSCSIQKDERDRLAAISRFRFLLIRSMIRFRA